MYRINRLNRPVLITPDEVVFHIASDGGIDERQILNNIIVAEERFIAPAIGNKFYEDFISKKNLVITSENQAATLALLNTQNTLMNLCEISNEDIPVGTIINAIELVADQKYTDLWNRFLWKITAECVDFVTTVPSWLRHTNSGQQQNSPKVIGGNGSNTASGDKKDVEFKMQTSLQDRIDPLLERMRLWICERKSEYPLYGGDCGSDTCSTTDGAPDGISKKTDFILGLYNDED